MRKRLSRSDLEFSSYERIKEHYDTHYTEGSHPYQRVDYADNLGSRLSFALSNFVYFYVDMHAISGDQLWLDMLEATIDHVVDNTDKARELRGDIVIEPLGSPTTSSMYFQAPFPHQRDGTPAEGWSALDGSQDGRLRTQVLQDGQIIGYIAAACDYIIANNITSLLDKASDWFKVCKAVMDDHATQWIAPRYHSETGINVAGAFYYPERLEGNGGVYSHPLPYNHMAGFFRCALLYDVHVGGEDMWVLRGQDFYNFTRDTRKDLGSRFLWRYGWRAAVKIEDVNHGSYTFRMLYDAHRYGYYGVTQDDMVKYANSLLYCRKPSLSGMSERFDKTGDIPGGEVHNVGQLVFMAEFVPEVFNMVRDVIGQTYIASYGTMLSAYAAILRYKQANGIH